MLMLCAFFGVLSAVMGYYFALWIDLPILGSMALTTGIVFLCSFTFSLKHGLLAKILLSPGSSF